MVVLCSKLGWGGGGGGGGGEGGGKKYSYFIHMDCVCG